MTTASRIRFASIFLFLIVDTGTAACQSFAQLSFGATRLQPPGADFTLPLVRHTTFSLGRLLNDRHGIEVRLSRFDIETTQPREPSAESGTTVGIRATSAELGYFYRLSALGIIQPRVGLGIAWIPVRNWWQSDTPRETERRSVYAMTPSLAFDIPLAGPFALELRSGYQLAGQAGSPGRIGLTGFHVAGGVQLVH
jgi:hypothetical protein